MKKERFKSGEKARITTGFTADDDYAESKYRHFLSQHAIVKILKSSMQETIEGKVLGYYVYAEPKYFPEEDENGLDYPGYDKGVQFVLEEELVPFQNIKHAAKKTPTQLPKI